MISIYGVKLEVIQEVLQKNKILDKTSIAGECLDYVLTYDDKVLLSAFEEYKDNIYSTVGKSLAETFAALVIKNDIKFSVAESLTGGRIASKIVEIAGVSSVMMEGVVCYSNESKHCRLGVENWLFETVGAVSKEVCKEMLTGQNKYGVRLAMATTGIAGPTGDSKQKQLGLTYVGTKFDDDIVVTKNMFSGSRKDVIKEATNVCIGNAIVLIKKHLAID